SRSRIRSSSTRRGSRVDLDETREDVSRDRSLSPGRGLGRGSLTNLQLFAGCVAIWGSTWLAITFQLGHVAPEASVGYRFLLAAALLFAYCRARGLPLRYRAREHAWIAL